MKKNTVLIGIVFGFLVLASSGCNQSPRPLKEGVVWSVRWTESSTTTTGLYRSRKMNPQLGGSYGEDMYGVLYPSHVEVRFVGSRDSHALIIPMRQIIGLEFGDGGVSAKQQ